MKLSTIVFFFAFCFSCKAINTTQSTIKSIGFTDDVESIVVFGPIEKAFKNKETYVWNDKKKDFEKPYYKGKMHIGTKILDIDFRARGNSRLQCEVPPLKINFKKSAMKGTFLEGSRNLKLVGHCNDKEFLLNGKRELFQYKLAQTALPQHIRTQELKITYKDEDKTLWQEKFGFVLENAKDAASRSNMKLYEIPERFMYTGDSEEINKELVAVLSPELKEMYSSLYKELKAQNPESSLFELTTQMISTVENRPLDLTLKHLEQHYRAKFNVKKFRAENNTFIQKLLKKTDKENLFQLALFNTMINNQDWNYIVFSPSYGTARNVILFTSKKNTTHITPYDMNLTGFYQGEKIKTATYEKNLIDQLLPGNQAFQFLFDPDTKRSGIRKFLRKKDALIKQVGNFDLTTQKIFKENIHNFFAALQKLSTI